jgi:site-specific DNA-methyltransferase (adenine-specific)
VSIEFRIGDVFERLAAIPDGSIDLIATSPPFLALRSYLPDGHPDKHREIGSEPTPAEFLDTMLALTAEFGRVLAPHGSICVELGDKFSGSGGAGGDYDDEGMRAGQGKFGSVAGRDGWPLAKSLTGIPTLYTWSLAYGRNLLTGLESPAGQWRIRNVIVWARPNPSPGALGDKFRPATSYITVACKGPRRYFDLDAVRTEAIDQRHRTTNGPKDGDPRYVQTANYTTRVPSNVAGAPPLDWHTDEHPEDGDWLWKLPTRPYRGSHYATFPLTLPKRLIEAMCPQRVCTTCGKPSERITAATYTPHGVRRDEPKAVRGMGVQNGEHAQAFEHGRATKNVETVGWSDCGHDTWRTGIVLDPFAGSGTTLEAAQLVGRHAIGIDLDERNAELARDRVGMFLEVVA